MKVHTAPLTGQPYAVPSNVEFRQLETAANHFEFVGAVERKQTTGKNAHVIADLIRAFVQERRDGSVEEDGATSVA